MSGAETATSTAVPFRPEVLELMDGGGGRLIGSRCPACGAHFFPVRDVCSGCLGQDMERVALSSRGSLYTYTVVRQSVPGFSVPYLLGYVDLPEGVRVLGPLAGLGEDEVHIGMTLGLATRPVGTSEEGHELIGYVFQPEAEGNPDD